MRLGQLPQGYALLVVLGLLGHLHAAYAAADPVNAKAVGGMGDLLSKAKAEGGLLIYGAPSQDKMEVWFKGFQDKYGIPIQYYRAPTNPIYQRFSQEQQVGKVQADALLLSEPGVLREAVGKGWISEYTPENSDRFPVEATLPSRAYPLYLVLEATGWNTRVTPPDLQQKLHDDPLGGLLDPRLKGKIALVTVLAGGPQLAAYASITIRQAEKYGWTYLEQLAKQAPTVLESTPNMLDAVIAGDYWASPDANPSVFGPKVIDGAPIAFRSPDVAGAAQFLVSIANHAPHPYAARLFEEWATSAEGQALVADVTQAEVSMLGLEDHREIRNRPWYTPPKEMWFGWSSDPQLEGQKLKDFYARWQSTFGRDGR